MIEIDGSFGEGGGQIVRSSLTLSMLTRQPVHLYNIRALRRTRGLRPQHLNAVNIATKISRAEVTGAKLDSTELIFSPNSIHPGRFKSEIRTAGSTTLVLQTIFLPLLFAGANSNLLITGGTHVNWSPCFEYTDQHWRYYLECMGAETRLTLEKAGFYPEGGGRINAAIHPVNHLNAITITRRGEIESINGISAVANLDIDIAKRQKKQALQRLINPPFNLDPSIIKIKTIRVPSYNKGTYLFLLVKFSESQSCFTSLGEKSKPAEKVADEAVDTLEQFFVSPAAVDPFLVDQLLIPMSFANGKSTLRTNKITSHIRTNLEVIKAFFPVKIEIVENGSNDFLVSIQNNATFNPTS